MGLISPDGSANLMQALLPDLRQDRENTAKGRGGGGLLVYAKSSVKVLKLDNELCFNSIVSL